ncbi:MAG TPA: hypothetical protein VGN80_07730 [Devosiaceae bacterium]|jgi:hypothetical protein|nr:hypothetical protein [Devosiaceae bacterium]
MAGKTCDLAIFGSTPLAQLLAGLLAAEHGQSVCLVGTPWSPFHLPRRFDLSVVPATRPETWALLAEGTAETLRLLAGIGRGLFERVDPLVIGETAASIDMLAHLRHVASGTGLAAERVTDSRIVAAGTGCRIRDAALLVTGRLEPALESWLDRQGVQRLPADHTSASLRRDGSAQLQQGGEIVDARRVVLADDAAIRRHLPAEIVAKVLQPRAVSSVVTEPARPLAAPFVHYLDRGVMLGQRGGRGPVTALADGDQEVLPRIGSCLAAQVPLLRAGQTRFERLETLDGAPLVGSVAGSKATLIAGFGVGGAFFAPALARLLAGAASAAEESYFAARGGARAAARRQAADWTDAGRTGHAA